MPTLTRSSEEVESWLVRELAKYLGVASETVDPDVPFADYGLDSSVAVTLTELLGSWLGVDLSVTLFWEYPNITVLSAALGRSAGH